MPLVVVDTVDEPGGDWIDPEELAGCAQADVDLELVASATADLLFALSGYQFGTVTETVRPYRTGESCGCGLGDADAVGFSWTSHSAWSRAAACGCSGPSVVRLTAPITGIGAILVDGDTLTVDDDFVVYDRQWLVRVGSRWPCCQDLTAPTTADHTFSVTYSHGEAVPAGGRIAAQVLGCELAKALAREDCAFSGRVQNVTRDGVSAGIVIVDADAILSSRRTGIQIVDLWLASLPSTNGGGTITRPFTGPRGLVKPTTL